MKRLAEVDEVVEVILFAADPANSFMTGQELGRRRRHHRALTGQARSRIFQKIRREFAPPFRRRLNLAGLFLSAWHKTSFSRASGLITAASNSGISQQAAVGLAAGVALTGLLTLSIAPAFAAPVRWRQLLEACAWPCRWPADLSTQANRRLTQKAINQKAADPLGNCLPRTMFMRRFDDALANPRDDSKATGTLLVVKADQLRAINDDHGYDAGDDVIKALASTLLASVRKTDFVGRLDGDEFGVFLWGAAIKDALMVSDRIRRNVGHLRVSEEFGLSISVGGAILASQTVDADDGLRFANRGLEFARLGGGDRTEMIYVPATGEPVQVAGVVH
jgi:diguanylate cyclase (GGDEF)-like protein